MQPRLIFAVAIFLASYLPLSVILLAQDFDYTRIDQDICIQIWLSSCEVPLKNTWISIFSVFACFLGLLNTFVAIKIIEPKHSIKIKSSKHVPADLMNYVLPYVVSFMGISYSDPEKIVGFIVFFAWIFLITYKSGQIVMNPVLSVFGWRLYEIEYVHVGGSGGTYSGLCLSKISPELGEVHRQATIQDILIIKEVPDVVSS